MYEIAEAIAAVLSPLSVPLLTVVAIGVWKLDRRVIKLETHLTMLLDRNARVDSEV